jgi:alpha-beta hydrolase superfamily lysophospholipase
MSEIDDAVLSSPLFRVVAPGTADCRNSLLLTVVCLSLQLSVLTAQLGAITIPDDMFPRLDRIAGDSSGREAAREEEFESDVDVDEKSSCDGGGSSGEGDSEGTKVGSKRRR